jgi:hypothetical protein
MHYRSTVLTSHITSRLNLYKVKALLLCRIAFVRVLEVTWNKTRQSTFGIQIYHVTLPSNGYFVLSVYPSGKQQARVYRKTASTRVLENSKHACIGKPFPYFHKTCRTTPNVGVLWLVFPGKLKEPLVRHNKWDDNIKMYLWYCEVDWTAQGLFGTWQWALQFRGRRTISRPLQLPSIWYVGLWLCTRDNKCIVVTF